MSLLSLLAEYLVDKHVCTGYGKDCFSDFMPEGPDTVVVLHEYSGDPVVPYTEHVHRSVQVKVRSATAEDARTLSVNVCNALRSTSEDFRINFSDTAWGQVYIRQTPFKLQQDESGRVIYCFNLGITTNILE